MKSHTGYIFSLGKVKIVAYYTKQKVNARSSTELELIGVKNRISKVFWTRQFLECQGFKVKVNIIDQDNTSTMKLKNNGKARSVKRTQYYDIKYFYVTYLIGRDKVKVIYCPTYDMLGWGPRVCPPSGAFVTARRDFISRSVRSLLTALTYPKWYTRLPVVHLVTQVPRGLPGKGHQSLVINLVALCMLLRVRHPDQLKTSMPNQAVRKYSTG